jgi:outer membrane biosynthesis protein TonB
MANARRRFIIAFAVSLLLHALIFAPIARRILIAPAPAIPSAPVPLNFNLHPPKPPTSNTEAIHPTDDQVGPTDLIAEENSKAADLSDVLGERLAPFINEPSNDDQVAGPPAPPTPPQPSPTQPKDEPQTPPQKEKSLDQNPDATKSEPEKLSKPKKEKPTKPKKDKSIEKKKAKDNPNVTDSERMKLAQNNAPNENVANKSESTDKTTQNSAPENGAAQSVDDDASKSGRQAPPAKGLEGVEGAPPGIAPGQARGRVDGGVLNEGFVGFEAMKSDVAPYLKQVRTSVERKWFAAMAFRYQGVSPTKAIVDCAISSDGKLVSVEIRDEGSIPLFAKICKDAIESAAPFPPFPFKVPDMYANKNLEIRWTFNFMK